MTGRKRDGISMWLLLLSLTTKEGVSLELHLRGDLSCSSSPEGGSGPRGLRGLGCADGQLAGQAQRRGSAATWLM